MSVHLTLTGAYAGSPICEMKFAEGDTGAHLIYAPLDDPEFRATVCPECLKAYVGSFDVDELKTMPNDHWVKQAALTPSGQAELF